MNVRERFRRLMHFQPVDRVPFEDWGYWGETLDRWREEGMPKNIRNIMVEEYLGLEERREGHLLPIEIFALPLLPEKILEETDKHIILMDGYGMKVMRSKNPKDYFEHVLEPPVKDMASLRRYLERVNPDTPGRFPKNWDELLREYRSRTYPLGLNLGGFWAIHRGSLGLEGCSIAYFEQPELIEVLTSHWLKHLMRLTERVLDEIPDLDFVQFWEDMAGHHGPLVSPELFRKFVAPAYKKITDYMRSRGVDVITMDSDGNVNCLIPDFLACGINGLYPMEVRGHMDVLALRKQYPQLLMTGGIDKYALEGGPKAIDHELFERLQLPWLIRQGGYIPTVDHRVHPGVSYENYRYYLHQKHEIIWSAAQKI